MDIKTIVFVGPQGSGKGTQVRNILEYLAAEDTRPVVHLETGKGFRAMTETGGYTGKRVKEILAHGEMVPNFLTSSIVMNEIAERITEDAHLVIDGFPRNVNQARVLEQMMEFYKRPKVTVVHLEVPDDVVITRMLGRGREDDVEELIAERLRLYHVNTEPLISHYQSLDITEVITVDGTKSIEEVWQVIKANL